jgi:hypothetical protein
MRGPLVETQVQIPKLDIRFFEAVEDSVHSLIMWRAHAIVEIQATAKIMTSLVSPFYGSSEDVAVFEGEAGAIACVVLACRWSSKSWRVTYRMRRRELSKVSVFVMRMRYKIKAK